MGVSRHVKDVDDDSFDREVLEAQVPVVVKFEAGWCPPCRALAPIVERVAAESAGRVRFVRVDTDESPRLAERCGIRGVPTMIVFRGGQRVASHLGMATRDRLLALIMEQ